MFGYYLQSPSKRRSRVLALEGNPVFVYHDAFNPNKAAVEELKRRYREGSVPDVEVKRELVAVLERFLEPIRARRAEYAARPRIVDEILASGSERARREAAQTLHEVRHAMKLDYFGR